MSSLMQNIPLLCLHGALGTKEQFQFFPMPVLSFNFEGHGLPPWEFPSERDFLMSHFVDNIRYFLEQKGLTQVNLCGYSMGGYAALLYALKYPETVNKVVTLGTKYFWTPETAIKESRVMQADFLLAKAPHFVHDLQKRHGEDRWRDVLSKTSSLLHQLGQENHLRPSILTTVSQPVLVMVGDRDKMVGVEESLMAYRALPQGEFCVLPGSPHPLEEVAKQKFLSPLEHFLQNPLPSPFSL
jgi:pimeloyl-ACP methyl ester carboxylesterase